MQIEQTREASGKASQVFVVGMNGSGTTMLLDHLANHSEIYGYPIETKSLPYFFRNQDRYGDLGKPENLDALWADLKASVLAGIDVQVPDTPTLHDGQTSVAGAFDFLMSRLASAAGKRVWCEKTPMYVHHLELLAREFPNARFIHVIRDGRDCAASFNRRWQFNPIRTIYRWKKAVQAGQRQGVVLNDRYLEVRYEEVTRSPTTVFRSICAYLELPFEDAVLSSARSRPNTTTPAHGKVERNERSAFSYFDEPVIQRMESIAGKLLAELGYPCANPHGDLYPGKLQLRCWQVADDMRRLGAFATRNGRLLRPSKWRYLVGRIRSSLKQKSTL